MVQTPFCAVDYLEIDPTTRCNFSCIYCYGRNVLAKDLSWRHFTKAIETFPNLRFVELHGEGEPLLHPLFFDMAAWLRSRDIKISVFTNGSLLDSTNVQKFLDTGFEKIVISLDTVNPDRFKRISGYDLHPVLEGILRLISERNASNRSKPAIGIASTIFKDSIHDIPSLVYLCGLLALDGGVGYQPLNPAEYYSRYYSKELKKQIVPLQLLDIVFRELSADPFFNKTIEGYSLHRGFFDELFEPLSRGIRCCPWIDRGAYITASGYVTPCCMIKESDAIGKIGEIDASQVIEDKQQMKSAFSEGMTPNSCQKCEVAAIILNLPGNVFEPISAPSAQLQTDLSALRDEIARWQTVLNIGAELSDYFPSNARSGVSGHNGQHTSESC